MDYIINEVSMMTSLIQNWEMKKMNRESFHVHVYYKEVDVTTSAKIVL